MALILRELKETDEQAFLEGIKEWEGESPHWYSFIWDGKMTFGKMLELLKKEKAGVDLAPNRVPHTMLYGFLDDQIIGRVSVRHSLNEYLRHRGGNIGYAVAKRYRQKGFATEMVRQSLPYCKSIGIKSVMVTCADTNTGSWKIIEKLGGRLEDKIWDSEDDEMIRRYWIDIAD